MSDLISSLTERAIAKLNASGRQRILITLAGMPGSGKSTTAAAVAAALNQSGIKAAVVGMDGYHYTRADLEKRIGAERAQKFRGAPYTFDAQGVVDLARALATPGEKVSFPTFDHAIKDPIEAGGEVASDTQVIILEGLYLHLSDPVWNEIVKFASDTWFASVYPAVARKRLAERHLASGIVSTLESGELRADSNDLPNGEHVVAASQPAAFSFSTN